MPSQDSCLPKLLIMILAEQKAHGRGKGFLVKQAKLRKWQRHDQLLDLHNKEPGKKKTIFPRSGFTCIYPQGTSKIP